MKSSTVLLGKKEKKRKVKDISVVLSHSICQIEMRDFLEIILSYWTERKID